MAGGGRDAAVAVLAYANTLNVPFLFDDQDSVVQNPTIRRLGRSGPSCRRRTTARRLMAGRLNLSLAVNYAIGGLRPWSYHAVNLLVHISAASMLAATIRRTLLLPCIPPQLARAATALAYSIALLWAVHPLQTESVTYISQRAESLVSLCYLMTLYCAIRGAGSPRPAVWYVAAVLVCAWAWPPRR